MDKDKALRNLKSLFHALTLASLALTQLQGSIPAKYALYATIVSATISGALHLLTRLYPELANGEVQ